MSSWHGTWLSTGTILPLPLEAILSLTFFSAYNFSTLVAVDQN
jgi:hypothetical protein